MIKQIIYLLLLLAACAGSWLLYSYFGSEVYLSLFYTFLTIAVTYAIVKFFLSRMIIRTVKDSRTRHSLRRAASLLGSVVVLVVVIRIWIENPQALLVSYGLVGAGLAIALQDFFKNIVGGIVLFINGLYRVGDRIEVGDTFGDVIDIGILYTSLLEIRGWVDGDQATGRITLVPNGRVLSGLVHNYSKDHDFIWDEIAIPITYESDWKKATGIIKDIASQETKELTERAAKTLSGLNRKYYVSDRETNAQTFMRLTDNWILLMVRYVSEVRSRRALQDKMSKMILETFEKEEFIEIASETMVIEGKVPKDK